MACPELDAAGAPGRGGPVSGCHGAELGGRGAGKTRGGFGVDYRIRIRRGEGLLSFLMDHGRFGPPGLFAGKDGARPGIIMPDRAFLLGSKYYQEQAPTAKDRARHTALGLEIEVPAGVFHNCVEVTETSPLELGEESIKVYCPNVGLVIDEDLELIAVYEDAEPPEAED